MVILLTYFSDVRRQRVVGGCGLDETIPCYAYALYDLCKITYIARLLPPLYGVQNTMNNYAQKPMS